MSSLRSPHLISGWLQQTSPCASIPSSPLGMAPADFKTTLPPTSTSPPGSIPTSSTSSPRSIPSPSMKRTKPSADSTNPPKKRTKSPAAEQMERFQSLRGPPTTETAPTVGALGAPVVGCPGVPAVGALGATAEMERFQSLRGPPTTETAPTGGAPAIHG